MKKAGKRKQTFWPDIEQTFEEKLFSAARTVLDSFEDSFVGERVLIRKLHNTEGNSDKIYILYQVCVGDGLYNLEVDYGRRTGSKKTIQKCKGVSHQTMIAIANDLVREKENKGYVSVVTI